MESSRFPKPTSRPVRIRLHFQDVAAKLCYSRARQAGPAPQLLPHPEPGERARLPAGISPPATRPLTQPFPAELGAESRLRLSPSTGTTFTLTQQSPLLFPSVCPSVFESGTQLLPACPLCPGRNTPQAPKERPWRSRHACIEKQENLEREDGLTVNDLVFVILEGSH